MFAGREEGTIGEGTIKDMNSRLMGLTRRGDHLGASEKDGRAPG